MSQATLHLVCGKIGAGKSTLTAELGRAPATVVIGEDAWLDISPGPSLSRLDRSATQGR